MPQKSYGAIFGLVTIVLLSLARFSSAEAASEFQLQPITTTTLCTAALNNCAAAGLPNVYGAKLYRPTTDVLGHAHVGVEITHDSSSYINFMGCSALAQRGYTVLCADGPFGNSTFANQFAYYGLEQVVPTVASAINYLRNNVSSPRIDKVLIFGHSGGGSLQPFYENVAENGPSVCQGREKLIPCVDTNLHNLPKADGVMLFDAHPGLGIGEFTYMDPAIIVNSDPPGNVPTNRDPSLDMFSTANGYDFATNGGDYSAKFVKNFLKAQADRNEEVLNQALDLLQQERIATGNPNAMGDDIPFNIIGGGNAARLWQADSGGSQQNTKGLLNCTQQPHTLLSHDGTRPFQVVCSVRPPSGNAAAGLTNKSNLNLTVHTYLGVNTIRGHGHYDQKIDDISGFDNESSATTTSVNIQGIGKHPNGTNKTTPLLIVANSGHYFLRFDEIIYDNATTPDKTYALEEGAVHGGTECTACEALLGLPQPSGPGTFGYFGDTFTRTFDFMAEWLNARF
ncbi:MAG TPA: hypothetical protein VIW67_21650 [Terriglobales bacterium]